MRKPRICWKKTKRTQQREDVLERITRLEKKLSLLDDAIAKWTKDHDSYPFIFHGRLWHDIHQSIREIATLHSTTEHAPKPQVRRAKA